MSKSKQLQPKQFGLFSPPVSFSLSVVISVGLYFRLWALLHNQVSKVSLNQGSMRRSHLKFHYHSRVYVCVCVHALRRCSLRKDCWAKNALS